MIINLATTCNTWLISGRFHRLRKELLAVSLATTTAAYIISGLTMFLLPPVPGMPVYLTGGLVMCPRAEANRAWTSDAHRANAPPHYFARVTLAG